MDLSKYISVTTNNLLEYIYSATGLSLPDYIFYIVLHLKNNFFVSLDFSKIFLVVIKNVKVNFVNATRNRI